MTDHRVIAVMLLFVLAIGWRFGQPRLSPLLNSYQAIHRRMALTLSIGLGLAFSAAVTVDCWFIGIPGPVLIAAYVVWGIFLVWSASRNRLAGRRSKT